MSHRKQHNKKCSRWSHCGRKKHKKKMRQKKKATKDASKEEGENDPGFSDTSCERYVDGRTVRVSDCSNTYSNSQGGEQMTGRSTEAGGETVSETIYIGGKWMPATEENLKKCRNTHDCFMQFLNEDGSLRDHNDPVPESHRSVPSGGPLTPGTVPTNVASYADGSQV
tara:strand:+ start:52 stop:555 length:504 start_codon:yes stop_codon:yes gene_type:complete